MNHCTQLSLCAGLALAGTLHAQTFTLQPLGGPQDPIALSASGTLGVRPHQFFWSFPDTYTALPASMDGLRSSPDGQWALGRSTVDSRAARAGRAGGFDLFPNSTTGLVPNTAYASSSGNNMVVGFGLFNGSSQHAFVWSLGVGTQDLGLRVGDRSSVLVDVSSGGGVSVGWGELMSGGSRHPLRYDSQGFTRLGKQGGGFLDGGEAKAVSADGSTIVGTRTLGSALRGFRWRATGGEIDLPSPADPSSLTLETMANDVSADGAWIVGQSQDSAGGGAVIATLWDAAGTPYRLSDLLGNEPLHESFDLRSLSSISDDGRTVSGMCFDPATGQFRAFVATYSRANGGDCAADLGSAGGQSGQDGSLDNNDFILFIDGFFASNAATDFGSAGGVTGPDGVFDNNDFIAFIDAFFVGCNG